MTKYERINNILKKIMRQNRFLKSIRFLNRLIKKTIESITKNTGYSERNTYQNSVIIDHSNIHKPVQIKHQPEKTPLQETNTEPEQEIYQHEFNHDIDFSNPDEMEEYADNRTINKEIIEKWVAAGILLPDEIRAAEKLMKKMRGKEKKPSNHDEELSEKPNTG